MGGPNNLLVGETALALYGGNWTDNVSLSLRHQYAWNLLKQMSAFGVGNVAYWQWNAGNDQHSLDWGMKTAAAPDLETAKRDNLVHWRGIWDRIAFNAVHRDECMTWREEW